MTSGYFILEGHEPVAATLLQWGEWLEGDIARRRVCETTVGADAWVSTVFLGIDHRLWGHGPPVLFETMTFLDGDDLFQRRYFTWAEAELGHMEEVERLQELVDLAERQLVGVSP
jgi:hypothetical protein